MYFYLSNITIAGTTRLEENTAMVGGEHPFLGVFHADPCKVTGLRMVLLPLRYTHTERCYGPLVRLLIRCMSAP